METDAQEEKADEGDAMPSTSSGIFSSVTSVEISDSESDTDWFMFCCSYKFIEISVQLEPNIWVDDCNLTILYGCL